MIKNKKKHLKLHLVSDSTGETLRAVSNAAAAQFDKVEYEQTTYPMVRTRTQLERVLKNIKKIRELFCVLLLIKTFKKS